MKTSKIKKALASAFLLTAILTLTVYDSIKSWLQDFWLSKETDKKPSRWGKKA